MVYIDCFVSLSKMEIGVPGAAGQLARQRVEEELNLDHVSATVLRRLMVAAHVQAQQLRAPPATPSLVQHLEVC